jgi:hypothetical protein
MGTSRFSATSWAQSFSLIAIWPYLNDIALRRYPCFLALYATVAECSARDLANAVAKSLGDQFDYEEQDGNALNRKKELRVYLQEAIRAYLGHLIKVEEREEEVREKAKARLSFDEGKTEIITIEVPDDFYWQR